MVWSYTEILHSDEKAVYYLYTQHGWVPTLLCWVGKARHNTVLGVHEIQEQPINDTRTVVALRWGKIDWKGHRGIFLGDGMLCILIEVVVTWLYMFVKSHRTVHLRSVRFTHCEFKRAMFPHQITCFFHLKICSWSKDPL